MKKKKKKNDFSSSSFFSSSSPLFPSSHFSSRRRERHENLQVYRHLPSSLISFHFLLFILLLTFYRQTLFFFFFESTDNCRLFTQAHRIPSSSSSTDSSSSFSFSSSLLSPCLLPSRRTFSSCPSPSCPSLSSPGISFLSFSSPFKGRRGEQENTFSKEKDKEEEEKKSFFAPICISEGREKEKLQKRRPLSRVSPYSSFSVDRVKEGTRRRRDNTRRNSEHGNERRRKGTDLRYISTFLDGLYLVNTKKEGEKKILREEKKERRGLFFHLIRSNLFLSLFFVSPFLPIFLRFLCEHVIFFFSSFFSFRRRRRKEERRRSLSPVNPLCLKCNTLSSSSFSPSSSSSPWGLSVFSDSSCECLRPSFLLLESHGVEESRKKRKKKNEESPAELVHPRRKRERIEEREKCFSAGEKSLFSLTREKDGWREKLFGFNNILHLKKTWYGNANQKEEKKEKDDEEEEDSLEVKRHLKQAQARLIEKVGDVWKRQKRDTAKDLSRREEEEREGAEEGPVDMEKRDMKWGVFGGMRDLERRPSADREICWSMSLGKNEEESEEVVFDGREIERTLLTLIFLKEYEEEIYNLFTLDFSSCLGGLGLAFERKASKLRCTYTRIFRSTSHDIMVKLMGRALSDLFLHPGRIFCSHCCHICKEKKRRTQEKKDKEKRSVQDRETSLSLLLGSSTPKKVLLFRKRSPLRLSEASEREEKEEEEEEEEKKDEKNTDKQEKTNGIGSLYSEKNHMDLSASASSSFSSFSFSSSSCTHEKENLRKEEKQEEQEKAHERRTKERGVDKISFGEMSVKEEEREEDHLLEVDLESLRCFACLHKDLEEKMERLIEERRMEGRELQEEKNVLAQDYYVKWMKAVWRDMLLKRLFPLLLQVLGMKIKAVVLHEWRKRRERRKKERKTRKKWRYHR